MYGIDWGHREFNRLDRRCVQFLKRLLFKNVADRYDADSALDDPWLNDHCFDRIDKVDFKQALINFRNYPFHGPL